VEDALNMFSLNIKQKLEFTLPVTLWQHCLNKKFGGGLAPRAPSSYGTILHDNPNNYCTYSNLF